MPGFGVIAVGYNLPLVLVGILQPYAKKPGAALSILKMLRVLIRHVSPIALFEGAAVTSFDGRC